MSAAASPSQPRFFAHTVVDEFLEPALVSQLLDFVEAQEERFEPTTVQLEDGTRVDPRSRISLGLANLGPLKATIEERFRAIEPTVRRQIGMGAYDFDNLELEIAAHGDGAFFNRHGDTYKGWGTDRVMSAVYYFHRQPRGFEGGALRLYPLTGDGFQDVQPTHNSLVVFPSFVQHEVMPVHCPSRAFMDSRFAINCWFRRAKRHKADIVGEARA